jgi:hypothetical protein
MGGAIPLLPHNAYITSNFKYPSLVMEAQFFQWEGAVFVVITSEI